MSFDRPSPDDHRRTVSDTELNEALENDELEKGGLDFDSVRHEEGQRSPGPEPTTPPHEDVAPANNTNNTTDPASTQNTANTANTDNTADTARTDDTDGPDNTAGTIEPPD